MRVQENIGKISWSFADKFIFLVYGFVSLFQMKAMASSDLGLFSLLIGLNTWIFVVSDSLALTSIIQFGVVPKNRGKVNLISLIFHISIAVGSSLIFYLFRNELSTFFKEPRIYEVCLHLPLLSLIMIPRTYCLKFIYREYMLKQLFFVDLIFFGTMTGITFYLIFILRSLNFLGMVEIYYWGTGLSSIAAVWFTRKSLTFGTKGEVRFKDMFWFSLPTTIYSALHSFPKFLDIYVMKYFFSIEIVGVYSSAKTLFRVFEESNNATYGLVYPTAVRLIANKNYSALQSLITKAVSFLLISYLAAALILTFGLSQTIVNIFLSKSYQAAVGQFNLLLWAAIFFPFTILSMIITAAKKPGVVLKYVAISSAFCFATYVIIGFIGNPNLIPIGYIVYSVVLGSLCFIFVKKNYGFPLKMLYRAFGDSWNFIKSFIKKNRIK